MLMRQGILLHYVRQREEILPYEGCEALEEVSQKALEAPSLEVLKDRLDSALSKLIW